MLLQVAEGIPSINGQLKILSARAARSSDDGKMI